MSAMIFHGGPLDGTSQETHDGFPAPDGYGHRVLLDGEWYYRFHTDDKGRHHYRFESVPVAPREEKPE